MLLKLTQITLTLDDDEARLPEKVSERLGIPAGKIKNIRIARKSLDARKKENIHFVYTLTVEIDAHSGVFQRRDVKVIEEEASLPFPKLRSELRPVIIGSGPAGLFAALRFTEYGLKPLILERGRPIAERVKDVERFWHERVLDPESNVQFGEGGAGTFSDGKLTTRVNDPRISYILESFVEAGADPEILYLAKPHIGTDRLRSIVVNLRKLLIERGCEVRFGAKATRFTLHGGKVESVTVNDGEEIRTDRLVLAIGHSARDTYERLHEAGVAMEAKSFAIGLRVEHPQALIDGIQYGRFSGHGRLPAAEYVLTHNMKEKGRSAYSFCMCPGGVVVNASSEPEGLVVNGMSMSKQDSGYANSALIVTVGPGDFGEGPLGGVEFQRHWERAAFKNGGGDYSAPAENFLSFLEPGVSYPLTETTFLPGLKAARLSNCLPGVVIETLREAMPVFGRKMRGFLSSEATLIGVETRTSSPLRIVRGKDLQSVNTSGLYPCGEGAGYAGGIISSALDGIKVADEAVKIRG